MIFCTVSTADSHGSFQRLMIALRVIECYGKDKDMVYDMAEHCDANFC